MFLLLTLLAATPSDACREHYAALKYRDAIAACTDALAAAGDRAELYTLIGLSLAGVGEAEKARRVFAALLLLKPDAALPPGLSPKLRAPFDAAKADAAPIGFSATRDGDEVVIALSDGPSRPVAELRVGAQRVARSDRVKAPPGPLRVGALDVLGGELASVDVAETAPAPAPVAAVVAEPAPSVSSRPALLSWKVWLVTSIVAAVVGGSALAWAAVTYPRARAEEWADAAAGLHGEAQRAQVVAGVGFGFAGLAAALTVVLRATE